MRDGTPVSIHERGTLYTPWHPTYSASFAVAGSGVNPSSSYVSVSMLMLSGYPADAMSNTVSHGVKATTLSVHSLESNRTRKRPSMDQSKQALSS
jgi:hypothetical protein